MAAVKEKHPSWFKMKLERRQLIRKLPPENAVNVLLACWDYLETGTLGNSLSPFESIAVSAFLPDLEEAWAKYEQRINARNHGKEDSPKNHEVSTDIARYRSISSETEVEPDPLRGDGSNTTSSMYNRGAASKGGPPTPEYIPEFPVEDNE